MQLALASPGRQNKGRHRFQAVLCVCVCVSAPEPEAEPANFERFQLPLQPVSMETMSPIDWPERHQTSRRASESDAQTRTPVVGDLGEVR